MKFYDLNNNEIENDADLDLIEMTQETAPRLSRTIKGASGGALVHSGLLEGVSGTTFHKNTAGNEGPAILSLGLLNSMTNVTFKDNDFFCKPGTFSTEELSSVRTYGRVLRAVLE